MGTTLPTIIEDKEEQICQEQLLYICGVIIIVHSIGLVIRKPIKLKDLTLNNFNHNSENGMMGLIYLILSVFFILFIYYDQGFPNF